MTKKQAIDLLLNNPYLFGHLVGFKDLTTLHNEWIIKLVRYAYDKTIQAHRNSFKTTCVSIAIVILVILMPSKKIAFIRKTDSDVKEIILQVQKILRTPQVAYLVKCIYGIEFAILSASQTQITTNLSRGIKGTAQVTGFGIGASVTGKHYDIIFTDDIVNVNDRISRAERERTKLFYQELQNIINRGGWINNTGTPWHKEDAFTLMPEPEKYDCYSTNIMSKADIEEKRKSFNENRIFHQFSRLYFCEVSGECGETEFSDNEKRYGMRFKTYTLDEAIAKNRAMLDQVDELAWNQREYETLLLIKAYYEKGGRFDNRTEN